MSKRFKEYKPLDRIRMKILKIWGLNPYKTYPKSYITWGASPITVLKV